MPVSKSPRKNGKRIRNIQTVYFYYDLDGRCNYITAKEYRNMKMVNTKRPTFVDRERKILNLIPNGNIRHKVYKRSIIHKNTPRLNVGIFDDYIQENI